MIAIAMAATAMTTVAALMMLSLFCPSFFVTIGHPEVDLTCMQSGWGLNAIRTYFQSSGKKFWQPRHAYSPTLRARPANEVNAKRAA